MQNPAPSTSKTDTQAVALRPGERLSAPRRQKPERLKVRVEHGEVQVLAPMHRGDAGVGAFNLLLQERLNPGRDGMPEARGGGRLYRPWDRVLQMKNDYTLEVFNGDLGTVKAVDTVEQELLVRLDDGREVRYPFASFYQLTHAYAISVHKAQGGGIPGGGAAPGDEPCGPAGADAALYRRHAGAPAGRACGSATSAGPGGKGLAPGATADGTRRAPRQTALAGLLTGNVQYTWPRASSVQREAEAWEGLIGDEVLAAFTQTSPADVSG